MFIVMLKLTDKSKIADNMQGHNAWLGRGFDDGVFLLAGTIEPKQGGAILADNISAADLQARVNEDPFVANNVVSVDISEITPARADERLGFLLG